MTSEFDSVTTRADDARAEVDQPTPSRRALRLELEEKKKAQIAREREMERLRELAMKRAEEITREREATVAREAEHARHVESIRNSQPLPRLQADGGSLDVGAAPPRTSVTGPSYAERGHRGAQRKLRENRRAEKKERALQAKVQRSAHHHPHRRGRGFVIIVVAGLMVSLALPATGFNSSLLPDEVAKAKDEQSVKAVAASDHATQIQLGDFEVTSYADVLKMKYGSSGDWSYAVTNAGRIRWPFPAVVPISSGFGGRVAPCFGCSSYHEGIDFNPEVGTPFFAVADGVVTEIHDEQWGLGKWVLIHHEVGNLVFDSLYAHMIRDSTGVKIGDVVKAGDYVGRVGNSGTSTGAHLHFEILIDGTPIDPFPWLKRHTLGN